MNAADNEAGNAAIDSLLNYETVKVRSILPHKHIPYPHPSSLWQSFAFIASFLVFFFSSLKPGTLTWTNIYSAVVMVFHRHDCQCQNLPFNQRKALPLPLHLSASLSLTLTTCTHKTPCHNKCKLNSSQVYLSEWEDWNLWLKGLKVTANLDCGFTQRFLLVIIVQCHTKVSPHTQIESEAVEPFLWLLS